jgi:homoserine dehydrogenase
MKAMNAPRIEDRVRPLKLALLGCGSVGSEVVRLLREHTDDLSCGSTPTT